MRFSLLKLLIMTGLIATLCGAAKLADSLLDADLPARWVALLMVSTLLCIAPVIVFFVAAFLWYVAGEIEVFVKGKPDEQDATPPA